MTNDKHVYRFRGDELTKRQIADFKALWKLSNESLVHRRIVDIAHAATFGKQAVAVEQKEAQP